jgi:thioredoxin reductase
MHHDAIVIGGSFAGLSAATYIARARRSVRVIDAGAPRNRFAAHSHGFFAQDGQEPHSMIATARAQLASYPNAILSHGTVADARVTPHGFQVALESGETFEAAKLVLAFGVSDVLPQHPGLAERWGKSVLHCPYCHGYEVAGARLGVLYSAERSVHQAMLIAEWGPTTLLLDGHAIPDPSTCGKLAERGIAIEPAPLQTLEGASTSLSSLVLSDGRRIAMDALFIAAPTRLNSDLAKRLGCAIDDGPFGPLIRTGPDKMTTVPGVYAAGDIARAPHSVTWAASDGVTAGVFLHQSLVFPTLAA